MIDSHPHLIEFLKPFLNDYRYHLGVSIQHTLNLERIIIDDIGPGRARDGVVVHHGRGLFLEVVHGVGEYGLELVVEAEQVRRVLQETQELVR